MKWVYVNCRTLSALEYISSMNLFLLECKVSGTRCLERKLVKYHGYVLIKAHFSIQYQTSEQVTAITQWLMFATFHIN